MVFVAFRRLVAPLLLVLAPFALNAAEPPPLAAYGDLPDIESVALSNSGTRVAAVMKVKGQRAVMLLTSDLKPLRVMPLQDAKVRSLAWIGDDDVVVLVSHTQSLDPEYVARRVEFYQAFIVPADPKDDPHMVFDKDPAILNAVFGNYGARQVGGRWTVYFSGVRAQEGRRQLLRRQRQPRPVRGRHRQERVAHRRRGRIAGRRP